MFLRYIFFIFSFIFFPVFFSKIIFSYKAFFPYKNIFSVKMFILQKSKNIFFKKIDFFDLVLQQMNNHSKEAHQRYVALEEIKLSVIENEKNVRRKLMGDGINDVKKKSSI